MRNIFKCGLSKCSLIISSMAVLGLLCAPFSALLVSNNAHASSAYDNTYYTTATLSTSTTGASYGGVNGAATDITQFWASYITDSTKWHSGNDLSAARTSLLAAFDHGRWGVSQYRQLDNSMGGPPKVDKAVVYWTEDTSLALTWQPTYVYAGAVHAIEIRTDSSVYATGNPAPIAFDGSYSTNTTALVSTSNQVNGNDYSGCNSQACVSNLLVYTDHLNIPTGYAGSTVPSSYSTKINYRPYVGYVVDGYNISTIGGLNPKDIGGMPYGLDYTMRQKQTDGTYKDLYTWNSPVTQYANTFKITTGFGDYQLFVKFRHPGIPYAPTWPDGFDLHDSTYNIKIDGSSYDSSTIDNSACANGVCAVASPYKDCTTFGTDIVGGFNCVLTNFGTWLRAVLVSLFGAEATANFSDYISNNTTETFGLTSVITAPLTIVQRLSSNYYTCTPLVLPLPHLGANLTLPCMGSIYSSNFGALYTMYQTIVTGVIGYYVMVGLLNTVKGFKDPESDKIEVLAL